MFNENIWNKCKHRSMMGEKRIEQIHDYLTDSILNTPDDYHVAEIGVLKGGTSKYLCMMSTPRDVYLFDTFNGLPENFISKEDINWNRNSFSDTNLDEVKRYLSDCNNAVIIQGVFPCSSNIINDKKFSFILIDCLLYKSVYSSLKYFYKKIHSMSKIIIDDYDRPECPGVKKAVDDFLALNNNLDLLILEDFMALVKHKSINKSFNEIWNNCKNSTCLSIDRAKNIYEIINKLKIKNINGSIAELGVFRGGITTMMAEICPFSIIHAFDTFEGMPPHTNDDISKKYNKFIAGHFNDLCFDEVKENFKKYNNILIHKGYFPNTSSDLKNEKFMFCHLDFDLYKSCLDAMEFFYPLMVKEGVIVVDDYDRPECPGVKKAIDEYCIDKNIKVEVFEDFQALIRKK